MDAELLQRFVKKPEELYLWSRDDKIRFLQMYALFIGNEDAIYNMIYRQRSRKYNRSCNHECHTQFKFIFGACDINDLNDKHQGILNAIDFMQNSNVDSCSDSDNDSDSDDNDSDSDDNDSDSDDNDSDSDSDDNDNDSDSDKEKN